MSDAAIFAGLHDRRQHVALLGGGILFPRFYASLHRGEPRPHLFSRGSLDRLVDRLSV